MHQLLHQKTGSALALKAIERITFFRGWRQVYSKRNQLKRLCLMKTSNYLKMDWTTSSNFKETLILLNWIYVNNSKTLRMSQYKEYSWYKGVGKIWWWFYKAIILFSSQIVTGRGLNMTWLWVNQLEANGKKTFSFLIEPVNNYYDKSRCFKALQPAIFCNCFEASVFRVRLNMIVIWV